MNSFVGMYDGVYLDTSFLFAGLGMTPHGLLISERVLREGINLIPK